MSNRDPGDSPPSMFEEQERALLGTLEPFAACSPLAVNVDFNDLLSDLGETAAFELIGKLKDLLS